MSSRGPGPIMRKGGDGYGSPRKDGENERKPQTKVERPSVSDIRGSNRENRKPPEGGGGKGSPATGLPDSRFHRRPIDDQPDLGTLSTGSQKSETEKTRTPAYPTRTPCCTPMGQGAEAGPQAQKPRGGETGGTRTRLESPTERPVVSRTFHPAGVSLQLWK